MMTIDEIKEALADRQVEAVASATGLHRNTVSSMKLGHNRNPTYEVMRKLSEYLSGADRGR